MESSSEVPLMRERITRLVGRLALPLTTMSSLMPETPEHVLVISVIYRGQETSLRIELMDGAVRATSLICLVGVGIGFGSYLLYRLWNRFMKPALPPTRKRHGSPTPKDRVTSGGEGESEKGLSLPATPDSGVATMGNSRSNSATVTPEAPTVTFTNSSEGQKQARYRGKPTNGHQHHKDEDKETVACFQEEDGFLLIDTAEVDVSATEEIMSKGALNEGVPTDRNWTSNRSVKIVDVDFLSLSKQNETDRTKSNHALQVENHNNQNLLEMDRNMMLSTSTDLGFVSGHYSGHESSMDRSITFASSAADPLSSRFERDLNSNLNEIGTTAKHRCSPIGEDSNGNLTRSRSLSDGSAPRCSSYPSSPRDASLRLNSGDNSSFDLTKTIHSTPTESGDLSPFESVPRSKKFRPPSAPLTGSTSKQAQRCFSSDVSSTSADGSYCLWTGNSVDLGESFSGRTTPDSEALKDDRMSAVSHFDHISEEVQALRLEVDEMSERCHLLAVRESMSYLPPPMVDEDLLATPGRVQKTAAFKRHVYRKHDLSSSSFDCDRSVLSLNLSEDSHTVAQLTDSRRQKELHWDYGSDLGVITSPDPRSFLQNRPIVEQPVEVIENHHDDRMHKYLIQQSESLNNTSFSKQNSIHEGFIDDSYFGPNFVKYSPIKEEVHNSPLGGQTWAAAQADKIGSPVVSDKSTLSRKTSDSSVASLQLCQECQTDCCTKCGKKILAAGKSNGTGISSSNEKRDNENGTKKVANSTQTDCFASTQTDEYLPSLDLQLSVSNTRPWNGTSDVVAGRCTCHAERENDTLSGYTTSANGLTLTGSPPHTNQPSAVDSHVSCRCDGQNRLELPSGMAGMRSRSPARNSPNCVQRINPLSDSSCVLHCSREGLPEMQHSEVASYVNSDLSVPSAQSRGACVNERPEDAYTSIQTQNCFRSKVNGCDDCSYRSHFFHGDCFQARYNNTTMPQHFMQDDMHKSSGLKHCCHGYGCDQLSGRGYRVQQAPARENYDLGHAMESSHALDRTDTSYQICDDVSIPLYDVSRSVASHARCHNVPVSHTAECRLLCSRAGIPGCDHLPRQGMHDCDLHTPHEPSRVAECMYSSNNAPAHAVSARATAPPSSSYHTAGTSVGTSRSPTSGDSSDRCQDTSKDNSVHDLIDLDVPLVTNRPQGGDLVPEGAIKHPIFKPEAEDWSSMVPGKWSVVNIGERKEIEEYMKTEWKGNTEKAKLIRNGYADVTSVLGLRYLRQVRGDNYCAVRAAVFQVLVNGIDVQAHVGPLDQMLQQLNMFASPAYGYLQEWTFANRFAYDRHHVIDTVKECVTDLYEQLSISQNLPTAEERERFFVSTLNSTPDLDLHLLEAVKCLMMVKAFQYYEQYQAGEDVPTFVWLLYARDTSETPRGLLLNHLNKIGDSGGMEMVEMPLLGHALGVQIKVARPSQQGQVDFVTTFPDEGGEELPKVYLVAEDDRHYNVLLSELSGPIE